MIPATYNHPFRWLAMVLSTAFLLLFRSVCSFSCVVVVVVPTTTTTIPPRSPCRSSSSRCHDTIRRQQLSSPVHHSHQRQQQQRSTFATRSHGAGGSVAKDAAGGSSSSSSTNNDDDDDNSNSNDAVLPWDQRELDDYASSQGVALSLSTLGPGYRAVARSKHDASQILGYVEGFVRPGNGKLLHLDKMEVFGKMVQTARAENPTEFRGGGTVFGVGLLLGYLCLLHGREQGCTVAEFLAIHDEDFQHRRLVRYYANAGFQRIRYVGEDVRDIPDRLIWGGCGTLLRQQIPTLLEKWTAVLEASKTRTRRRRGLRQE
jgi:hypothetical protein